MNKFGCHLPFMRQSIRLIDFLDLMYVPHSHTTGRIGSKCIDIQSNNKTNNSNSLLALTIVYEGSVLKVQIHNHKSSQLYFTSSLLYDNKGSILKVNSYNIKKTIKLIILVYTAIWQTNKIIYKNTYINKQLISNYFSFYF